MTPTEDLELQLTGLVLVRALLEARGDIDLDAPTREIERVRARLARVADAGAALR
ncbi:MAG: hypothetical protein ACJ76I_09285 [Gaiellaceae bacterium]